MRVWPLGGGLQGLPSNPLMRLRRNDVVVSDEEKAA